MTSVIGVRFKKAGKVYYFSPEEFDCPLGVNVVVETARGIELGEVAMEVKELPEDKVVAPLKPVLRLATPEDEKKAAENAAKEKEAFHTCEKKILDHGLEMKLVDVEFAFDGSKILFYFTADGRVDFRELVKDLASVFRTRIELRQIGVRDEAKMLGGLGICGQPFCCSTFLGEFAPVSIKMAKEQGLSLNPTKISGTCGRLMCCLKYEQPAYEDLLRRTPKVGAIVDTRDGRGIVVSVNLLRGLLSVRLDATADGAPSEYHVSALRVVKDRSHAPTEIFDDLPDAEEDIKPLEEIPKAETVKEMPKQAPKNSQNFSKNAPKSRKPKTREDNPSLLSGAFVEKRAAGSDAVQDQPEKQLMRAPIVPEGKIIERIQRKTTPAVSSAPAKNPQNGGAPSDDPAKKRRPRGGRGNRGGRGRNGNPASAKTGEASVKKENE